MCSSNLPSVMQPKIFDPPHPRPRLCVRVFRSACLKVPTFRSVLILLLLAAAISRLVVGSDALAQLLALLFLLCVSAPDGKFVEPDERRTYSGWRRQAPTSSSAGWRRRLADPKSRREDAAVGL